MKNIHMENEYLRVDIGEPGNYNRARFDWTGFIRQVTLKDGGHTFCTVESLVEGQGTEGAGLCNEFGIHEPIGYDEIMPGEQFLKIGVGLLTRTNDKPYDFFADYPITPAHVTVETPSQDKVRFISEPQLCNGYAVRLVKELILQGSQLSIAYTLTNTGSKRIETNEYVHNFLSIDGASIGPDYELRFPQRLNSLTESSFAGNDEILHENHQVTWQQPVSQTFYGQFKGFQEITPFYWELVHKEKGVGIRESGDFPASRIALWGESHVVSPEMFIDIRLNPGETKRWVRVFEFFDIIKKN